MDLDLRLLRYFVVVADEANLSRAAGRLFVTQPALTRQIKRLEHELGVTLFVRSRAGMTLNEAGRALRSSAPAVLSDWELALQATRHAARQADRVLRVGFIASGANEATPLIVAEFRRRRPDWRVEMRQAGWSSPTAGLSDAAVDAALLRMPFPGQERLRIEPLFTEPRCVALASGHPLAGRDQIDFCELCDEPFVAAPLETGGWRDYWLGTEERKGRPAVIGAVTEHPDEWLAAIADGSGVALAPVSAARFYGRPGVVYRPLTGISPSQVGIGSNPIADGNPAVQEFVSCCHAVLGRGELQSPQP